MRFLRALVAVAGALLVVLGVLGVPAAILGSLDPIDAQLTNDSAPFGVPRSSMAYILLACVYLAGGVLGFFMFRWGKKGRVAAQQGVPGDVAASRRRA